MQAARSLCAMIGRGLIIETEGLAEMCVAKNISEFPLKICDSATMQ